MSTRSAESRENSPDGEPEKRTSKKRKVLSCYACRNRKMKCDRVYPVCGRCQRTGRADQCTYDPRLLEDLPVNGDIHVEGGAGAGFVQPDGANAFSSSASIPPDTLNWKLRVQERRLDLLERKLTKMDGLKNSSDYPPSHLDEFDPQADEPKLKEEMMFRGKGFKTQFYGSTSPFSLITHFAELQYFTRDALIVDSSMGRIRTDFKTFRNRRKAFMKENGLRFNGTDPELFARVPEKSIVDAATALYFQHFENSYRILHEPAFWKDYRIFWEHQQGDERSASFATTLILIVAMTKCLSSDQETLFIGDSSADREDASKLIEVCDAWLLRHSRKHLTLAFFQLQCLSLLAKRVNCIKIKQDWVNSGEVIRLAISAGIHRNPSLLALGRISEYEKEMRRRIWVTIMELELQSSVDCGLQSTLCGLYFDTQPPANLPDDAFSTDSQQMPASRPKGHFTNASYLTWSLSSLPSRVHLMQLLNNPTTDLQYSDVLYYDHQITSLLSELPQWDDHQAAMPSALLDVQLRQFLLILHRPYAMLASKNPRFSFSLTACVNAANAVVSLFDNLSNKGIFALNHLRSDVLRTVMTLAQVVYHISSFPANESPRATNAPSTSAKQQPSQPTDVDGPRNPMKNPYPPGPPLKIPVLPKSDFMTLTLCTSAIELLERARSIFEQKVMKLGTGYMEFWLISAAIGIMPSTPSTPSTTSMAINTSPDDLRSRGRKATERITSLCFRVLAMQKDPGNDFAASLRHTVTSASTPDLQSTASTGLPSGPTPLGTDPDGTLQPLIPGAEGIAIALDEGSKTGMGMQGPWDSLQDMQVDLGGWNFPDFWAFDVGGDF